MTLPQKRGYRVRSRHDARRVRCSALVAAIARRTRGLGNEAFVHALRDYAESRAPGATRGLPSDASGLLEAAFGAEVEDAGVVGLSKHTQCSELQSTAAAAVQAVRERICPTRVAEAEIRQSRQQFVQFSKGYIENNAVTKLRSELEALRVSTQRPMRYDGGPRVALSENMCNSQLLKTKQGKLPDFTQDVLKAWFLANVAHPYALYPLLVASLCLRQVPTT